MSYAVADIIRDVRRELDEIQANDAGFVIGTDDQDLDVIIAGHITDAVTYCVMNADESMLTPDVVLTNIAAATTMSIVNIASELRNVPTDAGGSTATPRPVYAAEGSMPPGKDFLRLCWASCSSWLRSVSTPLFWTDREAARLKDWYTTGTPERPVVEVSKDSDGIYAIRLYTCLSDDEVEVAVMCRPKITGSSTPVIDFSEHLYRAVVMYAAGLTLTTLRDQHADSLFNQALIMMGARKPKGYDTDDGVH